MWQNFEVSLFKTCQTWGVAFSCLNLGNWFYFRCCSVSTLASSCCFRRCGSFLRSCVMSTCPTQTSWIPKGLSTGIRHFVFGKWYTIRFTTHMWRKEKKKIKQKNRVLNNELQVCRVSKQGILVSVQKVGLGWAVMGRTFVLSLLYPQVFMPVQRASYLFIYLKPFIGGNTFCESKHYLLSYIILTVQQNRIPVWRTLERFLGLANSLSKVKKSSCIIS